jgi:hypothetical protein
MSKDEDIDVIAHKSTMAKFTVKGGTRPAIEKAIEEKLRSSDMVWEDDSYGINVVCVSQDKQNVWRPRKRFKVPDDGGE